MFAAVVSTLVAVTRGHRDLPCPPSRPRRCCDDDVPIGTHGGRCAVPDGGLALTSVSTQSALPRDIDAWRDLAAAQQPDWPDPTEVRAVAAELAALPPLVFAGECDQLKERLAAVARG